MDQFLNVLVFGLLLFMCCLLASNVVGHASVICVAGSLARVYNICGVMWVADEAVEQLDCGLMSEGGLA